MSQGMMMCRVYSLQQIEGYRPPILSGHKDALVGVFFAGSRAAAAAELDGRDAPDLLTISRDGALFMWKFEAEGGAAGQLPDQVPDMAEEQAGASEMETEAGAARPGKRRRTDEAGQRKNYSGASSADNNSIEALSKHEMKHGVLTHCTCSTYQYQPCYAYRPAEYGVPCCMCRGEVAAARQAFLQPAGIAPDNSGLPQAKHHDGGRLH